MAKFKERLPLIGRLYRRLRERDQEITKLVQRLKSHSRDLHDCPPSSQHELSRPTTDKTRGDVNAFWSERAREDTQFSMRSHWFGIPRIQRLYRARAAGGDPELFWVAGLAKALNRPLPLGRTLSLGCGGGDIERQIVGEGIVSECVGCDVAKGAIRLCKERAEETGLADRLSFFTADLDAFTPPGGSFDVVLFNMALHHVNRLESLLETLRTCLVPDGLLLINEYVGPSRFDLPERTKVLIRAAFQLIPQRYRRNFSMSRKKRHLEFLDEPEIPDPAAVSRADPSESIRSAEILDCIRKYYDIRVLHTMGGSLLHFVFSGIAGNFETENAETNLLIDLLVEIEDKMIQLGEVGHDFVCLAATPKPAIGEPIPTP